MPAGPLRRPRPHAGGRDSGAFSGRPGNGQYVAVPPGVGKTHRLKVLTHPAVLVVDEIGYLPVSRDGAVLFS